MTVKEIEAQTGMDRANIRFYEREGLIAPARMANGYRDYSKQDLETLLRVKLLRNLRVSLEEIKKLRDGEAELGAALDRQIARLEREKEGAALAQDVCRAMRADRVAFCDLDAKKYLEGIERTAAEGGGAYFTVWGERIEQVFHPWRRYFARSFDLTLCSLLWSAALAFIFQANLMGRSGLKLFLDVFFTLLLLLFTEPLLLHLFGTTPGKAIFGLRITNPDGSLLSYGEGLERTWEIIRSGMGYGIPVYNLVCMWRSYKRCRDGEMQPWDEYVSYSMRDAKSRRVLVFIAANALAGFVMAALISGQMLPPNRGDLTVAQFAQNYNYYVRYFGYQLGTGYMDAAGAWTRTTPEGAQSIFYDDEFMPACDFVLENGYVKAVRLTLKLDGEREWVNSSSYEAPLLLASLSFACAQEGVGPFSGTPGRIAEHIEKLLFDAYDFTEAGVAFSYETIYAGYIDSTGGALLPESAASGNADASTQSFSMEYGMAKAE